MVKRFIDQDPHNPESLEVIIDNKIQVGVDNRVKKAMFPIYWIISVAMFGMLGIFVTIALPIQAQLLKVSLVQKEKAFIKDVDAQFKAAEEVTKKQESLYIDKFQYYRIEEDEHRMVLPLFKDPQQATYVFSQINANILKELGFDYTVRGGKESIK